MRKPISIIAFLILSLTLHSPSIAVTYNSDPKIFITELVEDAMKSLSDKSISEEEKSKHIEINTAFVLILYRFTKESFNLYRRRVNN